MDENIKDSRPLIEQTADRLVSYIIENNLTEGMKLPSEQKLVEILGVGRSTLRESLRMLTSRNVLEVRHGAGTFVSHKAGVSDDPLGFTFIKDKEKLIGDLLEFRIMIEPRIAGLAAQFATAEEIGELTALCDSVDADILANRPHMRSDVAFHTKIAQCSRNVVMPNLQSIIQSSIALFIEETGAALRSETMKTHRAVLNAIRRREPTAAADAMMLHLVYNRDRLHEDSIVAGGSYSEGGIPPRAQGYEIK